MPDPNPNPTPTPQEIQPPAPAPVPEATPPAAPAPTPSPLNDGAPAPVDPATPPAPAAAAAAWSDDWREKLVGDVTTEEGKKQLNLLQRLADPKAMFQKLLHQDKMISSGQLKKPLPENPSPEEIAAYRTENGIPESHDKYDLTLSDGMMIGEADKPIVDSVLKALHDANAPQSLVTTMLNTYFANQVEQIAQRDTMDNDFKAETTAALRAEWGGDYTPNLNSIVNLIAQAPQESQDLIKNARMPDGRPLMSDPGTLRWLATLSRQINPIPTMVPGASNPSMAIADELTKLKDMMGDQKSEYWKGPNANANQKRYRELLEAQERYKTR